MKSFFKSKLNIALIIILCVSILLMGLYTLWEYFLYAGFMLSGIVFTIWSFKLYYKNKNQDPAVDEDSKRYFDATVYDYDEDVYTLPQSKRVKTSAFKNKIAKNLDKKMPLLFLVLIGTSLIIFSLLGFFHIV